MKNMFIPKQLKNNNITNYIVTVFLKKLINKTNQKSIIQNEGKM